MDSIHFPQLAFEFHELINGSFVQETFSTPSSSKFESLLLEFISEIDHQSPKGSPDFYGDYQKDEKDNEQPLQQQKIHQLKTKLILSLQGFPSSSSFTSKDQQDKINPCRINSQGLIEKVFSLKQRLIDVPPDSVSSISQSLKPKSAHSEENSKKCSGLFDGWSDSDCQLLLEEIGTRRTTVQSIQSRLQIEKKRLCRSLHSVHRSLEKSLSSSSLSPLSLVPDCQKELPELSREETSRLLIGLEMLSLGFGIVQIPQWWIDQEQMKPMEERNLISINNGSEQVTQWMQKNLFPTIDQQLRECEKEEIISLIQTHRCFSGCQTFYFLEGFLSSYWRYETEKEELIKEVMMTEKQRLFKDLEKQLVIIGNFDYNPETEDQNIHFFDPLSRIQRKLSNQVGTWISSPSFPSPSSPLSFGIRITAKSTNESFPPSVAMSLKIQSIMDEINEIKRQHECKSDDKEEESNQKRIQNNLPPRNECAWDVLRSFLKIEASERIDIRHLSKEDIQRLPEEIKYLNQKDLEWIEIKGDQVKSLIDRLCLIFSDDDCEKIRETGLKVEELSAEEFSSLLSKISKRSSLFPTLVISKLDLNYRHITLVPVEIGQLSNLKTLDLSNNLLNTIPAEIGQLKNLQSLSLGSNQLTSIPTEIGQLMNLQTLDLWDNHLTSAPAEIGQLKNLQSLKLHKNHLTSVPAEIGQLMNLQLLHLWNNHLTSVPAEIGQLMNLQTLVLSENQLRSFPAEIGQVKNLQTLVLSSNQLTSIPAEICQLENLQTLNLYSNQITSVPEEIGLLKSLQLLRLDSNQLTSLPIGIGQLTNLQTLYLQFNQFTLLPTEISQLTNLQTLYLQYNINLAVEYRNRSHAFFANLKNLRTFQA